MEHSEVYQGDAWKVFFHDGISIQTQVITGIDKKNAIANFESQTDFVVDRIKTIKKPSKNQRLRVAAAASILAAGKIHRMILVLAHAKNVRKTKKNEQIECLILWSLKSKYLYVLRNFLPLTRKHKTRKEPLPCTAWKKASYLGQFKTQSGHSPELGVSFFSKRNKK